MSTPRMLSDLLGTRQGKFALGTGALLSWFKAIAGGFAVRNAADTADAELTASRMKVSGDALDLNSGSAGSGADWKYTLQRPASGMTADVALTMPPTKGSPGDQLVGDGAGGLSFQPPPGGATNIVQTDSTALAFGDASPKTMFTKPANSKVKAVRVYVDTAFINGTPSLSIGITGTTSKYGATTDVDLTTAGVYEWDPGVAPVATAEALIATYSGGGATSGAARIEVDYVIPT